MADPTEILDVLVVGGGPGGTAAAFRAQELGLKVLVIDYDDLMKRIRDYSKDKLILPDFGGGDKMKFPGGGALISSLRFTSIDKDAMVVRWKEFYKTYAIPTKTPVELLGLKRGSEDVYEVLTYDHGQKAEVGLHARHVVISIGRGVPRRFDIPGNTDGIAYRLSDPSLYVNGPACVIGGGTSAAEAVIAISKAKADAQEPTAVYWSYRGDKVPRVSKALAEEFFGAYLGNGNIRYHPLSEPASIVVGSDRRQYLSIRVDRQCVEQRPPLSTHLEFPKENCIACIGEDIPEAFLGTLGIQMATGGPSNKKRMVVTRTLETQLPNVYMVGDILSQAYFETDAFPVNIPALREVTHRGNIKSALRDGVLVAGVIQQKLAGRTAIEVRLDDADDLEPEKSQVARMSEPVPDVGPPPPGVEPRKELPGDAFLVRLLPTGVRENEYSIPKMGVLTIGREGCTISMPTDTMLSEHHASISQNEEGYFLRDDGSSTGTFLRAAEGRKLGVEPGDLVRMGRQFLRFEKVNGGFGFTHYDQTGREVGRHGLGEKPIILGREAPDVTLDPADKTMSRRHLAISVEDGKVRIKDLKSVNGTFLRVRGARRIDVDDEFRVGQQRFVLSRPESPMKDPGAVAQPTEQPAKAEAAVAPGAALPGRAPAQPGDHAPAPSQDRPPASTPAARPAVASPPPPRPPAPVPPAPGSPRVPHADPVKPGETARPAPAAPHAAAASASGPTITFKGLGTFAMKGGQTLCEAAEANGVALTAECHAGICGSDPVRILTGKEFLADAAGPQEKETLEDLCNLKPDECRLACMVRVKGPVTVEILKT